MAVDPTACISLQNCWAIRHEKVSSVKTGAWRGVVLFNSNGYLLELMAF